MTSIARLIGFEFLYKFPLVLQIVLSKSKHKVFILLFFFNFSIVQQFERYFAANDVNKQGSFYLQSKIYRAHEMLKEFQEIEYLNYVMAEYKKLANLSFGGNIKATFKPAVASIKAGKKALWGLQKNSYP